MNIFDDTMPVEDDTSVFGLRGRNAFLLQEAEPEAWLAPEGQPQTEHAAPLVPCAEEPLLSSLAPEDDSNELFVDSASEEACSAIAGTDAQQPIHWGVRFRPSGQVFFFPGLPFAARAGSRVLVELEHGVMFGEVVMVLDKREKPLSPGEVAHGTIKRLASANDVAIHAENHILAAEAIAFCKTCIRQRALDMKLVDVEVMHDRSKIIFFFTAPARIDFRELVKDLVRTYRTRIELRQIGVRHETQMIGGLGNCGMVCCCHSYLRKFAPVTIKMAKEQNLFLNPAKLSGMCGRLLCCLSFEQSNYEEFNRRCPKVGKKYQTSRGVVRVLRANMFGQSISILTENNEEMEMTLEDWDSSTPTRMEHSNEPREASPQEGRQEGTDKGRGGSRSSGGKRSPDAVPDAGNKHQATPPPRPRKRKGPPFQ